MAQRLIVSNNNDSGRGSLREALRASQRGTGSFEIIFRGNNPANRNNLGLSEFTIALAKSTANYLSKQCSYQYD